MFIIIQKHITHFQKFGLWKYSVESRIADFFKVNLSRFSKEIKNGSLHLDLAEYVNNSDCIIWDYVRVFLNR